MTRSEGRRFALTLAAAFAVIALLANWRDRENVVRGAWILGSLLLIAGIAIPTRLGPIERAWMKFGLFLSKITSPLFLGVVYFVVFTPVGWIRRMFGRNSVAHTAVQGGYWKAKKEVDAETRRAGMERQF